MKKSKRELNGIRLGTDFMNDEQRYKFYRILEEKMIEYWEKLEKMRIGEIRARQEAHYIFRNYYRLGLDKKKRD